jgi:predicted permease
MLRPLPYPEPEQLVEINAEVTRPDGRTSETTPSMADVRAWQEASDVVSAVAGWASSPGSIAEGAEPERIRVSLFTEEYLAIHGVSPLIGREFTREDVEFGAPAVALLGYGYWQSRYAGRRDVIGETIALDDGVVEIVGVLPASFYADVHLARPLQLSPSAFERRGSGRPNVYARLQPGITVEQASERLSARMVPLPMPNGTVAPGRAVVSSRLESALTRYRTTVNVMAGAVTLIVLLACVNVAGLLLARGASRHSEVAVRASLGAGRIRLVRQLFTESLILAAVGGAFGVLLAWLSLDAIVANLPMSLPANSPIELNTKVLAFSAALLVATALLFGLVPAIRLSRAPVGRGLARGGRPLGSSLTRRGGQFLIAAEVALAAVLVAGAGLMLQSFSRLAAVDLAFEPEGLITMSVLPLDQDSVVHRTYYTDLVERLRGLPGVQSVGLVDNFVLGGGTSYVRWLGTDSVVVATFQIFPGYLETIRASLGSGRFPTPAEFVSGERGVVLSETAARQLFPEGPAVGRQVTFGGGEPRNVLAVIGDLKHGGPLNSDEQDAPQVYYPLQISQRQLTRAMTAVVRISDAPPDLANRLRETAHAIGPRVLVENIRSVDDLWGDRVLTPRRRTVMLGLLGGLGLALALVGVVGVTAYSVARRTSEIGVRIAFGARTAQVVGTMLRDSLLPILVGTVVGLGAAALVTRIIASFLFETEPLDPATFALVALTLGATGCMAALVPSLRAARVEPVATLRTE